MNSASATRTAVRLSKTTALASCLSRNAPRVLPQTRSFVLPPGSFNTPVPDQASERQAVLDVSKQSSTALDHGFAQRAMRPSGPSRHFGSEAAVIQDYDDEHTILVQPPNATQSNLGTLDTFKLDSKSYVTDEAADISYNSTLLAMEDYGIVEGEDFYASHTVDDPNEITDYDRIMSSKSTISMEY